MTCRRSPAAAVLLLLASSLLLQRDGALAGVAGSPHDVVAQGYGAPTEDDTRNQCGPCHMPAGDREWKFIKTVPPSLAQFNDVALACYSCHDGTTHVSPYVDASRTVFHPLSHGFDLGGYLDGSVDPSDLPGIEEKRMSCLTCHDPHDNAIRPFLTDGIEELCRTCHEKMVSTMEDSRRRGVNHPINSEPTEQTGVEVPLQVLPGFRVPFPGPYPLKEGKGSEGVHWELGGHLAEGGTGETVCSTCHAVHGSERVPPRDNLLAVDPVGRKADLFCEGCHRGTRGDGRAEPPFPNPGGTSTARTYHPCDDDISNGEDSMFEVVPPEDWPLGSAGPQVLLCTTCHSAHHAEKETPLLRPTEEPDFCAACHADMPLAHHHPAGPVSRCADQLPLPLYGGAAGVLHCSTCHRAHNAGFGEADESAFVPLLREAVDDEYCRTCHPAGNPTCLLDPLQRASHFMGDPTVPETYEDPTPPLRTEPWTESGLTSRYLGENGKVLWCLSCHTFDARAVVSGDGGTAGHLLARSGNKVEWLAEEEGKYLCTGCHGASPKTKGGGGTHPLMNAMAEKLGRIPDPPATVTPGGFVNCDSCHRSHGATTQSGVYILEAVEGENLDPLAIHPTIDFGPLCHKCHDPTKY